MDLLERMKLRTGSEDEAILSDCLESAKNAILSRRFPYTAWPDDVEDRYKELQLQCAIAMFEKQGAPFETAHGENGIQRTWGSEAIPKELLDEIVPICGVVR